MLNRIPRSGEIYKHFKNNLYQIITIAIDSETDEKMVVYQALYGSFKTYVRPLSMFTSEVDHVKYPEVKQKYRFELIEIEDNNFITNNQLDKSTSTDADDEIKNRIATKEIINLIEGNNSKENFNFSEDNNSNEDNTSNNNNLLEVNSLKENYCLKEVNNLKENNNFKEVNNLKEINNLKDGINTILMDFLDAKTYEQKLNIVISNRKHITDRLINDMAASIDCSIDEGSMEERINALIYSLKTISRFEFTRLR